MIWSVPHCATLCHIVPHFPLQRGSALVLGGSLQLVLLEIHILPIVYDLLALLMGMGMGMGMG